MIRSFNALTTWRERPALAVTLPLAVLLAFGAPARRAAADDDRALAVCARVYDAAACGCAIRATALPAAMAGTPAQGVQVAAGDRSWAARPVEAARQPTVRDFVQIVQACMAEGRDAPAD